MSKEEYFGGWLNVIDNKELDIIIPKLNMLYRKSKCYPDYNNIFRVFNLTPYNNLHTIILCQDPYFDGSATGIALGNSVNTSKVSASLRVIEEAVIDYTNPDCNNRVFDYSLESWCKQGILLLNTALTVEANKPNSHTLLWRTFMVKLLSNIDKSNPGLIWVLFGSNAKSFKQYIKYGNIIEEYHPAYYARNNSKLNLMFFINLKEMIKRYWDKNIEFYEGRN